MQVCVCLSVYMVCVCVWYLDDEYMYMCGWETKQWCVYEKKRLRLCAYLCVLSHKYMLCLHNINFQMKLFKKNKFLGSVYHFRMCRPFLRKE